MTKEMVLVLLLAALATVSSGPAMNGATLDNSGNATLDSDPTNDSRWIFFRREDSVCSTNITAHPTGLCNRNSECERLEGTRATDCGRKGRSCCYFTRTCDGRTVTNITSFVNLDYPSTSNTEQECKVTVDLINDNICQLRLDFNTFDLAQPNSHGVCETDAFTIEGSSLPTLCGTNSGQHMFVDIDPAGASPSLTIKTGAEDMQRKWNIIVTQIECGSDKEAPTGCLQYHTASSGVIQSFNYKNPTAAEITSQEVNNHLSDLDYSVCLSGRDGTCSVQWSPDGDSTPHHFMMTGDAANQLAGSTIGADSAVHDDCTDYVLIPSGVYTAGAGDKYCGLNFPTQVTSTATPFLLRVKTDADESTGSDTLNAGFSLKYDKIPC